jgi:hypothetical protein
MDTDAGSVGRSAQSSTGSAIGLSSTGGAAPATAAARFGGGYNQPTTAAATGFAPEGFGNVGVGIGNMGANRTVRRAGSAPVLSRMHSSNSLPSSLSRLGNASSKGALATGGTRSGGADNDMMEDWMFDIESVDAAIAAGATAANKAAAATGDGVSANHLRNATAAAAAAMRSGSAGFIDTGIGGSITNGGRLGPPQPASAVAQHPLGYGGHMSMSAHDFSTIHGDTGSANNSIRQQARGPPQPRVPATAAAQPANSSSTGTAAGAAGAGARTAAGTAAAAQGQGVAAGNSSAGASAEAGTGLHFDMSLSELETFDFDLYDD